jgi:hypothetical protein
VYVLLSAIALAQALSSAADRLVAADRAPGVQYAVAVLKAQNASDARVAEAAEDPALTAAFRSFLESMLDGVLDPSNLSDAMKAALSPDKVDQVRQYFAKYGKFESLKYLSEDSVEGYRRYHYEAIFSGGSQPLMFVMNSSGKLDGFFLQ